MKKFTQMFFSLSLILLSSNFLSAQCALPAMTLSAGSSGPNSISFSWVEIPGAQWYGFEYKENPSGPWLSGGTLASGSSKTINGLAPSTSYQVRAQSYCGVNNPSPMSNEIQMTTLDAPQCSFPPSISTSAIGSSTATISWTAVSGAGWYEFRYKLSSSGSWTNGGTASGAETSKDFSGLSQNSDYDFEARTYCPNGTPSPWSNLVQFHTAPFLTASMVNASNATINWLAGTGSNWYDIQYKEASSGIWLNYGTANGSSISKILTGLNATTTYDVRIKAYSNLLAPSPWSNTLVFSTTVATGCELPPVLAATTVNATDATITWPTEAGAAWFEFQYKEASSGTWLSSGTLGGAATSKILTGLTSGTLYDFRARTYCSSGIPSAWGATQFTTSSSASGCSLPPVLTATTINTTDATVTWPAVAGAAWFEFQYKETSSGTWLSAGSLSGSGTSKLRNGLSAGTQYDYRARTFCSNGTPSDWSSTLQFTTLAERPERQIFTYVAIDKSKTEVVVYPNPTSDIINIETSLEAADAEILVKVIDMNGRTVLESNTLSKEGRNSIQLSLNDLNVGIYNVELYSDNELLKRSKVIKK